MTGAFIILAVTIAVGILLWAWEKWRSKRHGHTMHHHQKPEMRDSGNTDNGTSASAGICCGMHAICEKTGQVNDRPVYYDDEELDRFAGREPDSYSDSEIEEFRDVLLTLIPSDAPGWTVSLEKRRISLPAELQPELELILLENIPFPQSDQSAQRPTSNAQRLTTND